MHHSDEDLKEFAEEPLDTYEKEIKKLLGKTGRFPEGKLADHDEGEIRFSVGHKGSDVIIDFGASVKWIGMNGNQAIDLGNSLIKHGRKANK
ncbi:hypothetical protein LCGC14_2526230 [marine sediment metagenome]|uniref:Uncharacterized protein n=1 Tax=marine sediment metagenome TaxID=412755 RepID=A0A0F9D6H5_9ZZZZ